MIVMLSGKSSKDMQRLCWRARRNPAPDPKRRVLHVLRGVCGVILGCFIGMSNLLIIDLKAAERAKKEKELAKIMKNLECSHRYITNVFLCFFNFNGFFGALDGFNYTFQ